MKNALILHGIFGTPKENWFPWLKAELEKKEYEVRVPKLPKANDPDRIDWMKAVGKALDGWDLEETVIIGHSLGATAALDFIESQDKTLGKFVSVAGFAWAYGFEANQKYLETKEIDLENVRKKIKKAVIIHSDNDPYVTKEALGGLAKGLKVSPIIMKGQMHFSTGKLPKYTKFPELLKYF